MATLEKTAPTIDTHFVLVSHTHWDREWYRPFEKFRRQLVTLVDRLLDILDSDPRFQFHFDGQTIVLDDYVAIRPQNEQRLREHLMSGRIQIGPWRVLPDQFLVTGESMIRNLQQGHRDCEKWGVQPLQVGYVPDMFGHVGIMPQLFAGFGIDTAVVWRGVGPNVRETQFQWEAPDGTRAFTVYLAGSYSNGANMPGRLDPLVARLDEINSEQEAFRHIAPLLVMNGSDHLLPQPYIPALMDEAVQQREGWSWEMGSLDAFVAQAREAAEDVPTHTGELRHPWRANILPGVTSVRSYQKQADFEATRLFEKYVEPLTVWADRLGGDAGAHDFIEYAWRLLVENHPHDSICGCSVDAVHDEMDTRYEKVMQVGQTLQGEAHLYLAGAVNTAALGDDFEQAIVTYTAASPSKQLLDIPVYLTDPGALCGLRDASGAVHPVQLTPLTEELFFEANLPAETLGHMIAAMPGRKAQGYIVNDMLMERNGRHLTLTLVCAHQQYGNVDIEARKQELLSLIESEDLDTIRCVGRSATKTLIQACVPVSGQTSLDAFAQTNEEPAASDALLRADKSGIETDAFKVEIQQDASLNLLDKRSGRQWNRVLRLVDEGDRGDTYNFDPVVGGQIIDAPRETPTVTVASSGPVSATVVVDAVYAIPAELSEDRLSRSTDLLDMPVRMEITCYRDLDRVDIRATVDNGSKDHRLRAVLDVPFTPDQSIAEGPFGIVRRDTQLPDMPDTVEQFYGTHPLKNFVCVEDDQGGLALFTRGIQEYEVTRTRGGAELALSLLRCVGWLSREDLEMRNHNGAGPTLETPGAQSLREQTFEFALMPYAGAYGEVGIAAEAHAYAYPPAGLQTGPHEGELKSGARLVNVGDDRLVVSAVTLSQGQQDINVRAYNTAETEVSTKVEFEAKAESVIETDFLESPINGAAPTPGRSISAAFTPSQIRTWRVHRPRTPN